MVDDSGR